jgi:hypothetical protein
MGRKNTKKPRPKKSESLKRLGKACNSCSTDEVKFILTHATYGPLFTKAAPTIIEKGYNPCSNRKGNKNAHKKASAEEATTTSPI